MPDAVLTVKFPTALDSLASLGIAANNVGSALSTAVGTGDTVLPMDTTALPVAGVLLHNGEFIAYSDKTPTQVGTLATPAVRGAYGSSAVAHAAGVTLDFVDAAAYHNALRDATIALETKLGIGAGAPASGQFLKASGAGVSGWAAIASGDVSGLGAAATRGVGVSVGNLVEVLSGGKIDPAVLPAISITDTSVVASQAAMLALTAQTGDVAVRTDINKSYILRGADPTVLGNWQELLTPTDLVLSVAGRTGSVTLTAADIAAGTFPGNVIAPHVSLTSADATLARVVVDLSRGVTQTGLGVWNDQTSTTPGVLLAHRLFVGEQAGDNPQGALYSDGVRVTQKWFGDPNTFDKWQGLYVFNSFQDLTTSTSTTQDMYGVDSQTGIYDVAHDVHMPGTYTFFQVLGGHFIAYNQSPSTVSNLTAVHGKAYIYGPGANIDVRAVAGWTRYMGGSGGTSSSVRGVATVEASGITVTDLALIRAAGSTSSLGTITNGAAFKADAITLAGTVGNWYGLRIGAQSVSGTLTGTLWQLYQEGTGKSRFEGNLQLGAAGVQSGALLFNGTTSGVVTLRAAAAAGTWAMTLPTATPAADSQALLGNADGTTSWGAIPVRLATVGVNVNTTSAQDLYTVPSGKTLVVTHVVVRSPSAVLSSDETHAVTFIRSSDSYNLFGYNAAYVNFTTTDTVLHVGYDTGGSIATRSVAAGVKVQAKPDGAFGSAATVVVDLFGYLY